MSILTLRPNSIVIGLRMLALIRSFGYSACITRYCEIKVIGTTAKITALQTELIAHGGKLSN